MKKILKNPKFRLFAAFCVLAGTTLIIHGCHKDLSNLTQQTTLSQTDISSLKAVYNRGIIFGSGFATSTSSSNFPKLIRNLNVKWDKYTITNRADNSQVVEFDMQRDTGVITFKKLNIGDTVFYRNKTAAVFIKLNNGSQLNFFMKVVEDYSKTHHSVINAVHYRNIPATFTGVIMYYTLDKKFINGYKYTAGKITGTVGTAPASGQQRILGARVNMIDPTAECGELIIIDDYVCYYGGTDDDPTAIFNGCEDISESSIYIECVDYGYFDDEGSGVSGDGTGSSSDNFNPANIIYNGKKPIVEDKDKCSGLADLWNQAVTNDKEAVGVLTADGQFMVIALTDLGSEGGSIGGLFDAGSDGMYYTYPDSQGAPAQTYPGMVDHGGQYYIPIVALIHTHNECLNAGGNGVTQNVSSADKATAGTFPKLNYYALGCTALATYNSSSITFNVISTDPTTTSCSLIH